MDKLLKELVERRAAMALSAFDFPPSEWAGFQKALGRYSELTELIEIVKDATRGKEDDEE